MNVEEYVITNFAKNDGTKLTLRQHQEMFPQIEWSYNGEHGVWRDVTISIDGDENSADDQFIGLADRILEEFPVHLTRAFTYLEEFFPGQRREDYTLDSIWFGRFLMFQGHINKGFAIDFTYGVYPDAFQLRVKFREDGWPVGFAGGPL